MNVRLDQFNPKQGLDRGKPLWIEGMWYLVRTIFFLCPLPYPSAFKVLLLKCFGAKIGNGVVIKPRVYILFPWKLSIGNHSWIGEEACLLNFESLTIGSHVCISQRAFLCGGNHDYRQPHMPYRNAPIMIEDGAWIGAGAWITAGVRVGQEAVIAVGSVLSHDAPPAMICRGNPCQPVRSRWN